jgi:hypothetical protein
MSLLLALTAITEIIVEPARTAGGVTQKRPRHKYEVDSFNRPDALPQRTDDDECLLLLLMR